MSYLKRFACNDRANAAIEYALIASGIAIAVVTSINQLGWSLDRIYQMAANIFSGAPPM